MALEFQYFPNEPIMLIRCIGNMNPTTEGPHLMEAVTKLKQDTGCTIYRIIDMTDAIIDFGRVVYGMADERDQAGGMNDPAVRTLMVGSDAMIQIAVSSAKTEQYGSARTDLFPSVEAALAQARAEIARK